jgi:hypothetical protein
VELTGIVPQLKALFAAKDLTWGAKAFFREFKYRSATVYAQKEALYQRIQDECYGYQPAQGSTPRYRYRKKCALTDGPDHEFDRLRAQYAANGYIEVTAW